MLFQSKFCAIVIASSSETLLKKRLNIALGPRLIVMLTKTGDVRVVNEAVSTVVHRRYIPQQPRTGKRRARRRLRNFNLVLVTNPHAGYTSAERSISIGIV